MTPFQLVNVGSSAGTVTAETERPQLDQNGQIARLLALRLPTCALPRAWQFTSMIEYMLHLYVFKTKLWQHCKISQRTSFHNADASLIIVLFRSCACRSLRKTECALKHLTCVECNICFCFVQKHSLCRYGCIIVAVPWPKVAEIIPWAWSNRQTCSDLGYWIHLDSFTARTLLICWIWGALAPFSLSFRWRHRHVMTCWSPVQFVTAACPSHRYSLQKQKTTVAWSLKTSFHLF